MISFLVGYTLPYMALLIWGLAADRYLRASWDGRIWFVVVVLVVPIVIAWISIEAVQRFRPRRYFDIRGRRRRITFGAGLIASLFGIAGAALAMPFTTDFIPDSVIIAVAAAVSSLGVLLLLPRRQTGHCVACGYDLRGCPDSVRCPECGSFYTA